MKRVIVCITVLVMLLSLCVPAMAADFTPSVGNKPAPDIVPTPGGDEGKTAIGVLRDENNKIIGYIYEDCIVITPVSQVDKSNKIPQAAKDLLKDIYEKLTNGQMTLPYQDVNPNLNPSNMVIRDLFDASWLCAEHPELLDKPGTTLQLTFDLDVAPGVEVVTMTYVNGKWVPVVSTVNNGDGTVTCVFEQICPIAFSVRTDVTKPEQTGDLSMLPWLIICLCAMAALVAVTVVYRNNLKKQAA